MVQEKHSIPSTIKDEMLISQVREILSEQMNLSPDRITDTQINEYLQRILTEEQNFLESKCIHTLFEWQVEQTPEQEALSFREQSLTYAELNVRANQLAHYLHQQGVGSEGLVGICINRSVELIVGLLGVLKAGGAFVLIPPDEPDLRRQTILVDARPAFLLTQEPLIAHFDKYSGEIIALDRDWVNIERQERENLTLSTLPKSLAYVIYSSGRGILVEHRGVCNRLQWLQDEFDLSSSDTVLHKASLALDTSIWEIFWPLLYGGRLVIASADNQDKLTSLHRIIAEEKISIAHFLPSELADFIESCSRTSATHLNSLRCVLCSGEVLQRPLINKFFQHFTCVLYNLYGSPETSGEVTAQACSPGDSKDVVSIGHPTHMSVYVLDKYLQLVPPGVTGEIYIAGEGLARGYLNDPEETSRRLIKNPFSKTTDDYLFKTDDFGRWLSDGTLEFLGCTTRHVWIKGFRVALGEIEAALQSHPVVEECVVLARKTETGQELVAYVVPSGQMVVERLESHLETMLPSTMVPRAYVSVSTVPLTTTGQVDELALTSLEVLNPDLVEQWEAKVRSQPLIEQVAVVAQAQTQTQGRLHLEQLLGDWKTTAAIATQELTPSAVSAEKHLDQTAPIALAFSDGGALIIAEDAPKTLADALIQTASKHQDKGIVYVLANNSVEFQSYESLLEEAKCILSGLYDRGLKPYDKAILQIQSLRDYFPVLWACILGKITPVTVAIAPVYDQTNSVVNKLFHSWELLEYPTVVASETLVESLSGLLNFLPMAQLKVLSLSELRSSPPLEQIPESHPHDVAFFQLTSGSTGKPKCIQETHHGIICHIHASQQFNSFQPENISCNWLPLDHVGSILTYHLKDVYLGCQQIQVPTHEILANPLKWLDLIEQYKVTHTWSPNFGYKLVSDSLAKVPDRRWDLSSMKFFFNGGEQVTLPVVSEFLKLVAPFQVAPQTMQPAYGMAEVCTAVTYQNHFDLETSVHRFKKISLNGRLIKADSNDTDVRTFISPGSPIPGVQLRIVDQDNQLLQEGVIGRLQISGDMVTPGYFNNPAANQEAFVEDKWFNSGDLGFIWHGQLILTGREKEMIIIRGANFYCYEIEDLVNTINEIEPTFVAACAIDNPNTSTEELAIFFVLKETATKDKIDLIKTIKTKVTSELGISPTYIIPLPKEDFPKTTSGKIQRTQLKKSLLDGQFQEILQEIDLQLANSNTLPDWFYHSLWRPKVAVHKKRHSTLGQSLIFRDQLGLGTYLCAELEQLNCQSIIVEIGSEFTKLNSHHYQINPQCPEHYQQLLASLAEEQVSIVQILHLWTYQEYTGEVLSLDALEESQYQGIYSLLFLVQALGQSSFQEHPIELNIISSYSQPTSEADKIAYDKAPLMGLINTISQEIPGLNCRHIDLLVDDFKVNASYILQEIQTLGNDQQVAYRNGQRFIPRLEKASLSKEKKLALPFKHGGMYLVTGGLGGIGIEVAKYLVKHYQARLLLVGRTPLPDPSRSLTQLEQSPAVRQRIEANRSLAQLQAEFRYEAVDICDFDSLQQVVDKAKSDWQCELDGVIHLAGVYHERLLVEETRESLAAVLRPKVWGTWVLHQLLKNHPNGVFISFSSLIGYFGGATVGAYAAANRFVDSFTHYQKYHCSLQSYCLSWSVWDEVGISQGFQAKDLLSARGYQAMSVEQGLNSFLVGLSHNQAHLLVGLDGSKNFIQRQTLRKPYCLQKLRAYFTAANPVSMARLQALEVRDSFGTKSSCDFIRIPQMPLLPDGTVDYSQIMELKDISKPQLRSATNLPKTEVEKTIASIWQEVFLLKTIDVEVNFFELGGNSLLMVQVINRLGEVFKKDISITEMFLYPTVISMAEYLDKKSHEPSFVETKKSENRGENRREKALRQRRR